MLPLIITNALGSLRRITNALSSGGDGITNALGSGDGITNTLGGPRGGITNHKDKRPILERERITNSATSHLGV